MRSALLGVSALYHDSAAALIVDGVLVAAAQEERFTRKKQDAAFPANAIRYVLEEANIRVDELDAVAFYDKPFLKFERLIETYHGFAPRGLRSFLKSMPLWIKEKVFTRKLLRDAFDELELGRPRQWLFPEHHLSHAASAFYPSPFEEAAILTVDGVGEWATTVIGHGIGSQIRFLRQLNFPHSLGLLYSAVTQYCGFRVNSGEYKLMGLAPYGVDGERCARFRKLMLEHLVDLRPDGSLLLNMAYFDYATGLSMCRDAAWQQLFGIPRRAAESELTQAYMDMALAVQQLTEEAMLRLAAEAKRLTGAKYLVLAGGVALNCVANGQLLRSGLFEDLWIQPAAGDAGGAAGAAYAALHLWQGRDRVCGPGDAMAGAYLGPRYSQDEIDRVARRFEAPYRSFADFDALAAHTATLLADGQVVGWFQDRMEYGPRALGNRSILGDPRHPEMQKKLNLKIKYREGFRPFAPSVRVEDIASYFELDRPSPYMLLVAPVTAARRVALPPEYENWELYRRLYFPRSDVPAITHVDFSARIQSVDARTNPRYHRLLTAFKAHTGYGLLVNTSFNVRGEPIVCSPEHAYRCFMNTEMDYLVMGDCLFDKRDQPSWQRQDPSSFAPD